MPRPRARKPNQVPTARPVAHPPQTTPQAKTSPSEVTAMIPNEIPNPNYYKCHTHTHTHQLLSNRHILFNSKSCHIIPRRPEEEPVYILVFREPE